MNTDTKYDKVW